MPLTTTAIEKHLHTARFGRPLFVHEELDSTNLTARRLTAQGAAEGTTVVACRQTAGRGRLGRSFHSPDGGLYLSMILRPAQTADTGLITSCAAVATARAIRRVTDLPVGIKWVNDLYIHGRKVCGILAQGELSPAGELTAVILGIGINVAAAPFPSELTPIATSLEEAGCRPSRAALVAAVLEEWEQAYATLHTGDFLEESRRLSVVLGREITVLRGDASFSAVAQS
ncbi:MAG: biotin--[Clostridia bacterium]|nr:biotin--[acetyl-CoA-carboxylase] ligase [Clostridia bacterium]